MVIYINNKDNITRMSTTPTDNFIEVDVPSVECMMFSAGFKKQLINGKIVDVVDPESINLTDSYSRIRAVSEIKVTINSTGKVFDGDEDSQNRMLRAINIAQITGETETVWRLADNTDVIVTLDELKEALTLAGKEMSRIWLDK